jgi:hypothetical protein
VAVVDLSPSALALVAGIDPWELATQVHTGSPEAIRSTAIRLRQAGVLAAEAARTARSADVTTADGLRTGAVAVFDASVSTARSSTMLGDRGERIEETARVLLDVADALNEAGDSVTARLRTLETDLSRLVRSLNQVPSTGPDAAERVEDQFFWAAVDLVRSTGRRIQSDLDGYNAVLVNRSDRLGRTAVRAASLAGADLQAPNLLATAGNELASMGNAVLNNPEVLVAFLAGTGLVALGLAGIAGGGVVTVGSAGTGAVAGVPLAGVGYGAVAAGVGIMLAASQEAVRAAGGAEPVEPNGHPDPD